MNNDLFAGHYLDERIQDRDDWQCDEVAVNLGEDPPIQAGEIVELVAFFLFEHG